MADRIVLLNQGRIEQVGEPHDLFDRPVSEFAATFVGEPKTNTIPVSLIEEDGRCLIEIGTSLVPVSREWVVRSGVAGSKTRSFTLGVRPQHLALCPPGDQGERTVHGQVYAVETLGSRAIFDIEIAPDRIVRVMTTTDEARHYATDNGAPISFRLDPDSIYLFDSETRRTVAYAAFSRREVTIN